MNSVKVEYVVHDVVLEQPKKKKSPKILRQSSPTKPQVASDPGTGKKSEHESKVSFSTNKTLAVSDTERNTYIAQASSNLAPLPVRPSTSNHTTRKNPFYQPIHNKPDWDMNLTVPDRDLLILEQDLSIAKYRSTHEVYDEKVMPLPQPHLTDKSLRKMKKVQTSEEHRDRLEHHSFSAAVNDPLPFHPYLRNTSGIHEVKWINSSKLPNTLEDWAKPSSRPDMKSRESFYKDYLIKEKQPVPLMDIDVQHSISSVESTFTKANSHGGLKQRQINNESRG
jgi:hypothetical protein